MKFTYTSQLVPGARVKLPAAGHDGVTAELMLNEPVAEATPVFAIPVIVNPAVPVLLTVSFESADFTPVTELNASGVARRARTGAVPVPVIGRTMGPAGSELAMVTVPARKPTAPGVNLRLNVH